MANFTKNSYNYSGAYEMFKPGFKEAVRNNPYGSDGLADAYSKLIVDKPLSHIKDGNEFDILCYCGPDGNLYDVEKRFYHGHSILIILKELLMSILM